MILLFFLSLLSFPFPLLYTAYASTDYHERLDLRPLPPDSLLASFNFRSNASSISFGHQNFRYFPRSLGQILHHANTRELHLRFSLGRWDADSWGSRPWDGAREGGTGVELWAWVEADNDDEAESRWITLTNALSGLFCASLNFIDSTRTIRPIMSFPPEGHHSNSTAARLHLLHGSLPREPVCTENLTPFLKLLPCKGKAGISSLLDGHKLFDASWQSMSIDVKPVCSANTSECVIQIDLAVDMVLDIERSKRQRDNPIPRPIPVEHLQCDHSKPYEAPESCYPLESSSEQPWTLAEIFGRPIRGSCPLTNDEVSETESVCLIIPHEREVYITGGAIENKYSDGLTRCFKVPEGQDFEIVIPQQPVQVVTPLAPPRLYAERSFNGHGQERGGVQAVFTNPSLTESVEFVYLESLPWFMKLYLHTLHARVYENAITKDVWNEKDIIKEIYYRPALDRQRPTHLEILLRIPAASTVTLTYDFEKAILRYTEYPPDANRGFDIPAAIVRLLPSHINSSSPSSEYIRTTPLLLSLPTPDFSMPYNVIILTSTVMAVAFGSIFNLVTRRFVGANEVPKWDFKAVLKGGFKGKLGSAKTHILSKGSKAE